MAGALSETELEAALYAEGFSNFEIHWKKDVFSGAPLGGPAAKLGTVGINFSALKPG